MAILKTKRIKWTNEHQLQLVEAVIKVEKEIMNESEESKRIVRPRDGQTTGKFSRRAVWVDKWSRIAELLPLELQLKSLSKHRCKGVFFEILKAYRDKLAGKHTTHSRRKMTKSVREILKKRQKLLKGQNTGSHWTEPACLLLIEAVMRVEEEDTRKKASRPIRSSQGRPMRKWERITNLLPEKLPGNCHLPRKVNRAENCRECFFDVLKSYRKIVRVKSKSPVQLTNPIFEMMKQREYLWKSRRSIRDETSLRTALNICSMITRSRKDLEQDPEQLSQASNSFGKMHTTHQHLLEERSICTAILPAAAFSTECVKYFETTTEGLNYLVDAEEEAGNDKKDEKSVETTSEVACSKNASGSLSTERQGSESRDCRLWSSAEISARPRRRKRDPENVVKLSPGVGHISKFPSVTGQTGFRIFLPCTSLELNRRYIS